MTVNPGFGGQKFLPEMLPTIRTHRPIRGRRDPPVCKDFCARELTTVAIDPTKLFAALLLHARRAPAGVPDSIFRARNWKASARRTPPNALEQFRYEVKKPVPIRLVEFLDRHGKSPSSGLAGTGFYKCDKINTAINLASVEGSAASEAAKEAT